MSNVFFALLLSEALPQQVMSWRAATFSLYQWFFVNGSPPFEQWPLVHQAAG
ncbi:hypothetical protein [Serratia symbiotica]|uniref:Uncharacterized protein n=1 Tax=Serratia symbiotica TaxID=138074 RepID=A0A068Z4G2_9GAMM